MSLFKCKMCGGSLDVAPGATVTECEYCGTKQTLPRLDDDKRANMYDRANHFRRNNDFDKAMGIYENILNEDSTDAEAYWSLVLCRYGVEYVEDPASHKRVPTVNRAQFTSIFDDDNYKSALQYADGYQRAVYEEEAQTINEIQKGILAISQKEEPFDVFICYKESDNAGKRTPDSVLAQDLYYQLTQEGFKVFFARITLENKLGSAYEPYIFAALNSAKVMVVLGTRPEFFNAAWVKNEWSRYLSLIKQGKKKTLIPAYKDMDPYDLPEEFSHLQAQDMSKLGFMQDLIRGIKKIATENKPEAAVAKDAVAGIVDTAPVNTATLLKRAFIYLEDEEWRGANNYSEKVLDVDPENAQAYVVKLCVEFRIRAPQDIASAIKFPPEKIEKIYASNNYRHIMSFGDDGLKRQIAGYISSNKENAKFVPLERIYVGAKAEIERNTYEACLKAIEMFNSIPNYKDSAALAEACRGRLDALKIKADMLRAEKERKDEERRLNSIRRKKKAAKIVITVISIIVAVITALVVTCITCVTLAVKSAEKKEYKNYSIDNIDIAVTDKQSSVEEGWSTEYSSVFSFTVTNNCLKEIEYFVGEMVFYDGDKEIGSSTVRFTSKIESASTKKMTVDFSGTNNVYRTLYETPFERMRIEYKITSVMFEDASKYYDEGYKVIKSPSDGALQNDNSGGPSLLRLIPGYAGESAVLPDNYYKSKMRFTA